MTSKCVLDASALLAYLHQEPGHETVADLLEGAAASAVNISEVVGRLADEGIAETARRQIVRSLEIDVVPFDEAHAHVAAGLRAQTRGAGLSLGDRACLAAAITLGVQAVTTDRAWRDLKLPVEIRVVR